MNMHIEFAAYPKQLRNRIRLSVPRVRRLLAADPKASALRLNMQLGSNIGLKTVAACVDYISKHPTPQEWETCAS